MDSAAGPAIAADPSTPRVSPARRRPRERAGLLSRRCAGRRARCQQAIATAVRSRACASAMRSRRSGQRRRASTPGWPGSSAAAISMRSRHRHSAVDPADAADLDRRDRQRARCRRRCRGTPRRVDGRRRTASWHSAAAALATARSERRQRSSDGRPPGADAQHARATAAPARPRGSSAVERAAVDGAPLPDCRRTGRPGASASAPAATSASRTAATWRRDTASHSSTGAMPRPSSRRRRRRLAGDRAAFERAHRAPGDQRVAVHAHEAVAQALFEVGERVVEHVGVLGGAQGHVLQLGLQVQHLGDRHAQHAATVADDDHRSSSSAGRAPRGRRRAEPLRDALQRRLQALAPHRLGQVVDRFEVEGLQRVLGVRGDEHHRRRRRALAQLGGELQCRRGRACGCRAARRSQLCVASQTMRLRRVGGFADDLARGSRNRPPGRAGAAARALRRRRAARAAVSGLGEAVDVSALTAAPRSAPGKRVVLARFELRATSCIRRSRSRTLRRQCRARPRGSCGTLLTIESTARPSLTRVRTRIVPPSAAGSTPWRTAFSTSGCSSSGGTRARGLRRRAPSVTCRRLPKRICSIAR